MATLQDAGSGLHSPAPAVLSTSGGPSRSETRVRSPWCRGGRWCHLGWQRGCRLWQAPGSKRQGRGLTPVIWGRDSCSAPALAMAFHGTFPLPRGSPSCAPHNPILLHSAVCPLRTRGARSWFDFRGAQSSRWHHPLQTPGLLWTLSAAPTWPHRGAAQAPAPGRDAPAQCLGHGQGGS